MATYNDFADAAVNLERLSKIGTKDKKLVRRHAQMIAHAKKYVGKYTAERDILINAFAKKENGELVPKKGENGQQGIELNNEPEFSMRIRELNNEQVVLDSELPKPFTFDELMEYNEIPEPSIIAGLGPFVVLDES